MKSKDAVKVDESYTLGKYKTTLPTNLWPRPGKDEHWNPIAGGEKHSGSQGCWTRMRTSVCTLIHWSSYPPEPRLWLGRG